MGSHLRLLYAGDAARGSGMGLSVQVSWEWNKGLPAGWVDVVVRRWVRKRRLCVCDVSVSVSVSVWILLGGFWVFGSCARRVMARTSRPGFEGG